MNRRSMLLGSALAVAAAPALAGGRNGATPGGFAAAWRKTTDTFQADLKAEGVNGGALRFRRQGRALGDFQYGLADVAANRKVDIGTIWHWASITKTFTAIGLMQLRDRGLVSLDDPMVKYLSEVRPIHDPFGRIDEITIRHLLSHSAGLRGPTFPWGGDQPWHPHEPKKWSQVEAMMPYTEIEFRPGSKYSYSNLGLSLVGRIIEEVSGQPISDYLDKNILKPLGMADSYFDLTPYFLLPRRSNNYTIERDGKTTTNGLDIDTGATIANGGLNGPIPDFVKYTDFLLGVGDARGVYDTVLKRSSLKEMWTPQLPAETGTDNSFIGLGFFIVEHALPDGRKTHFYGHAGYQMAFHTMFQVNPDSGCAFIGAVNTVHRGYDSVWAPHLRDAAYDRLIPLFPHST